MTELSPDTFARLMVLFQAFLPMPIRTEEQLLETQAIIDDLPDRDLDEAEQLYLELLGTLVHAYEEEHVVIPELSGVELLRELIVERELTQRDLVRSSVFATDSVAPKVLASKRSLNVDQVRALAQYFRLPADVFLRQLQAAA
jgi:HTH-type transcriptional regulator / antitoxin HigA